MNQQLASNYKFLCCYCFIYIQVYDMTDFQKWNVIFESGVFTNGLIERIEISE